MFVGDMHDMHDMHMTAYHTSRVSENRSLMNHDESIVFVERPQISTQIRSASTGHIERTLLLLAPSHSPDEKHIPLALMEQ